MKSIRVIGFEIEKRVKKTKISNKVLSEIINCDIRDIELFYKGRKMMSYNQLEKIADCLNVGVDDILKPNDYDYNKQYVDCMTGFKNIENREAVLDDIYDYLDLMDEYYIRSKE